ncbi:unnamed protein product [Bathycoccus prasinos]
MFASSSSLTSSFSTTTTINTINRNNKSSSSSLHRRIKSTSTASWATNVRRNTKETEEEESNKATLPVSAGTIKRTFLAASLSATFALATPFAAMADRGTEVRLPPIDNDPNRCERAFVGNTIGQANAVSDKTLDLRKCQYDNVSVKGITLSGALMVDSVFDNSDFSETVMSKVYATKASFKNVNFTNAVIDRATFDGSDMTGANFQNAVLTGVSYEGANLTGANFEEALIGDQDVKLLCLNPTVVDESRMQIGCKN